MNRKVVLDTETTGLDPKQGHRIISIGCVEIINGSKTGRNLHIFVNPERTSDPAAQAIHGISDDFLRDKPKFAEIAQELLSFLKDDPLIIHNAPFDLKFLRHELQLANAKGIEKNQIIDTLLLARSRYPGSPASLDALCRKFNIDNSDRINHGALIDSELLASVYIAMMGTIQKEINLQQNDKVEEQNQINHNTEIANIINLNRDLQTFNTSEEELNQHIKAISKLKVSIWKEIWPEKYSDTK